MSNQRLYPQIWPEFQWSHDDKYFSRIFKGLISDGPPKTSVYVPENLNIPTRIVLMEIPSLSIIGQQAIFNVVDCHLLWQDRGDFAVKVDRHAKSKKEKL